MLFYCRGNLKVYGTRDHERVAIGKFQTGLSRYKILLELNEWFQFLYLEKVLIKLIMIIFVLEGEGP